MVIIFENKDEIKDLENRIKNSTLWFNDNVTLLEEIAPISYINLSNKNNYYLIYIDDLKTFNTLPSESGVYKMFCFVYNMKKNDLDIYEYYLSFNKFRIN